VKASPLVELRTHSARHQVEPTIYDQAMVRARRPRHFVSRRTILLLRPLFRYSLARDAYVLRLVGSTRGPVLRRERRRRQREHAGPERRKGGIVLS
jgi:hypothetical protein